MASMIPVTGEVESLQPPPNQKAIESILQIPKGRQAQFRRDSNGATWWFWRTGRDLKKRNVRAKLWYRLNTPGSEDVYFEGPVLYLSARETFSIGL